MHGCDGLSDLARGLNEPHAGLRNLARAKSHDGGERLPLLLLMSDKDKILLYITNS